MGMAVSDQDRAAGGRWITGRRDELSRLEDLVAGVSRGVGGLVLIEGEQGIGKTSLLNASLTGSAAAGCTVFSAAADELLQHFPLRLMAECLSGAVAPLSFAELSALGGDPVVAGMERLLADVDRLCAVSPVILVAEDLQWADEASVQMWLQLGRSVGQLPLLLIGSARSEAGRVDTEQLRRSVALRNGLVLTLQALPAEDVAALVGRLLGGRQGHRLAAVTSQAGGNPLYVHELAESLLREGRIAAHAGWWDLVPGPAAVQVPVSLVATINHRLGALPSHVVDALRWAAVLGSEFTVTDLSAVTRLRADELVPVVEHAMAADVLIEAGPRLGFRHGLIRRVLYEGMPTALRVALHLQAAQALASAGALPERVAAQLTSGEERPLAVTGGLGLQWAAGWLAVNAPALVDHVPQAAATLLQDVTAQLPPEGEHRELLRASLVRSAFRLAHDSQVEHTGADLAATSADPDLAAEMAWLVGYAQLRTRRPAQSECTVAAALTRSRVGDRWAGRLRGLRAVALVVLGDLAEASSTAQSALECADKAGDSFGVGYALHAMSFAAMHRRDDAAATELIARALLAIGDDPQASDLRVMMLANNASCLLGLDRPAEALAAAREAVVLAEHEAPSRLAGARLALADHYFSAGEWDNALAELELAAMADGQDHRQLLVHGLIALIAAHRGDLPAAAAHLRGLAEGPPHEPMQGTPARGALFWERVLLARALIAEQETGPAAAAAVLAPCLEPAVSVQLPGRLGLLPTLVRLALANGDVALATAAGEAAAADALEVAADPGDPVALKQALARHCRGLAQGDAGLLQSAAAYLAATGRPLAEAAAQEDAAEVLARRGDTAAARRALAGASSVYARIGASFDQRRAATRLRPFGVRPSRIASQRPATGWDALTPTELAVARLVAKGRSNPDIAAEMFLSRNTVQTHVSHILAKLAARSRAEIIAEAFRHPPAGESR
jgi:DNA-binding CsgD family transcriptional regulator